MRMLTHGMAVAGCLIVLSTGCGRKAPRIESNADILPDLPGAKIAVEAGQSVVFHNQHITLGEIRDDGDYAYTVGVKDSGTMMRETASPGDWRLHKDLLLRLSKKNDRGDDTLLSLYWLPKLEQASGRIDPSTLMELKEGEHRFFDGGFVSLDRVRANDPGDTDDERAEVTLLMNDVLYNVAVLELGSIPAGDMVVVAENVYDGDRPGEGLARIRIARPSTAWSEATGAKEIEIESGGALEERSLLVRTDTLEDRAGGWRALVSLSSSGNRRDAILREGESLRAGTHELHLTEITEKGLRGRMMTYAASVSPEDAFVPGIPREKPEDGEATSAGESEATKTTRRVGFSQSFDFQGARFTLATLYPNDPTSLGDDAAEFQVAHSGTIDRFVTKQGQRHTVHGDNRWWIIELKELSGGRNGQAEVTVETGRFVGFPAKKSERW